MVGATGEGPALGPTEQGDTRPDAQREWLTGRVLLEKAARYWPVGWFAVLPVVLLWPVLFGGRVLFWGTPLLQFWGWRQLVQESYLAGHVPLWNPYLGAGAPLAANVQSAAFYPLGLIFLPFPVPQAMGYSAALHLGLAGGFLYLFGRHGLGLGRPASALAGTAFMLSSFVVARLGFLSMTQAVAWIPLMLLAVDRTIASERPWRWALTIAPIAFAMPLLAGHAQFWFYGLILAGLYGIFRWLVACGLWFVVGETAAANQKPETRNFARPGLALGLGLALAAIQIVPTAELVMQSVRAGGVEASFAMAYSLWPWQVIGLLTPDFFGTPGDGSYWGPGAYWEFAAWIGTLPAILAAAALVRVRSAHAVFFGLVAGLALLLATGSYLPIFQWVFDHVPGFNLFQAPARLLLLTTLGGAVLAGLGAEALFRQPSGWSAAGRLLAVGGIGTALAGLLAGFLLAGESGIRPTFAGAVLRLGLLLAASGGVFVIAGRRPGLLAVAAALGLTALDLATFGGQLIPTTGPELYTEPVVVAGRLETGPTAPRLFTPEEVFLKRFFATHSFRGFGSAAAGDWHRIREQLLPDTGIPIRLPELYNYDPLQRRDMRAFWRAVETSGFDRRLLAVANVGAVAGDRTAIAGLRAESTAGDTLHWNPAPLPRAFVVGQGRQAADLPDALAQLQAADFDPVRMVVLQAPASLPLESGGRGQARIVDYEAGRVVVVAELDGSGYLVLSDAYDAGWRVRVDERPAPLLRANAIFRAVALGPGSHRVEFRYEPLSFRIGAAISGLALIAIAGPFVRAVARRERRKA